MWQRTQENLMSTEWLATPLSVQLSQTLKSTQMPHANSQSNLSHVNSQYYVKSKLKIYIHIESYAQ